MSRSDSLVRREDHDGVTVLVLNRPDQRNALSRALIADLIDALDGIASQPGVRAVVIAAEGPVFCAGMDLKEAAAGVREATSESSQRSVDDTQAIADLIDRVHTAPRPVVAALHGDAYGGGAGLALSCDLVVMADSARLGFPEVRRGLVGAIVLQDLVRQVGDRRARELLLLGTPIESDRALAWGLVNRVVHRERCRDEAIALARELAACAPNALATTKHLLDEATRRPAGLRGAAAVSAAVRDSDEAREGLLAYFEKREPRWQVPAGNLPSYDRRDGGIDPDLPTGPGPA
jgi:methylglutaconyl-CoA hydratase